MIESYIYIIADEDCIETPFQVLELTLVVTLPVEEIKKPIVTLWRDLQTTMDDGTSKGWGKLVDIPENKDQFGLGYEPSKATLKGKGQFPPIQETFVNKGVEHGGQVSMISNKSNIKGESNFIHEFAPGEKLKN